jgi:hypothetical protein
MKSLFEDGFAKVRSGVTTLEELLRVANPPEQPAGPRPSASHDKKAA